MENLGKQAKDKITGFEGVIIGKCYYLTGCHQYGLTPKAHEGKIQDTQWFDEKRIEIVGPGVTVSEVSMEENPGGPNRDCPKVRN